MNSNKRILLVLILVIILPIIINEVYSYEKKNLIKDAKNILKNITEYENEYKEIVIDNQYILGNKSYKVNGTGVIFLDDDTFFLGTDDKCIMKLNYSDELMYQEEECPIYRMFNGIKSNIVTSGDGLYQDDDIYYFKGTEVSNYVNYNDKLWRILEFNSQGIKLISNSAFKVSSNLEEIYEQLNAKYKNDKNLLKLNFCIEEYNFDSFNCIKNIDSYSGLLTLEEYFRTINYNIKDDKFNLKDLSFLSKEQKLSSNYNIKSNGSITKDNTNIVYEIIFLNKDVVFKEGIGTKELPYTLN